MGLILHTKPEGKTLWEKKTFQPRPNLPDLLALSLFPYARMYGQVLGKTIAYYGKLWLPSNASRARILLTKAGRGNIENMLAD